MKITNFYFQSDLSPVILWQYLDAKKLLSLIQYQQDFMDEAITNFFSELNVKFFNISTAGTNGLVLWGRLLNVGRPVLENDDGSYTEFTDEQYRMVLRAQIYLLAFDGSIKALNSFFKILFPDIAIAITDNYDMSVSINVLQAEEDIADWQVALLNYLLVPQGATGSAQTYALSLPRPSGVKYILNYNVDYSTIFGFEGMTFTDDTGNEESIAGFDNGTFIQ